MRSDDCYNMWPGCCEPISPSGCCAATPPGGCIATECECTLIDIDVMAAIGLKGGAATIGLNGVITVSLICARFFLSSVRSATVS